MSCYFFLRENFSRLGKVCALLLWFSGGRVVVAQLFFSSVFSLDLKESAELFSNSPDPQKEGVGALYKKILALQECFMAIERCTKPTIVAVHGRCIGGGSVDSHSDEWR